MKSSRSTLPSVCVCFVCDDNFLPGLLVLLYSLLKNEPSAQNWSFLGFYDDLISPLSQQSKIAISSICSTVRFENISVAEYRNFRSTPASARLSLLKFECFRVTDYDLVLYLDTDIVVLAPLSKLMSNFVASKLKIAGVENKSRSSDFRHYKFSSLPMNAGVFLLHGNIGGNIYDSLLQEAASRGKPDHGPSMICQPIMNSVLGSESWEYLALPCFFNFRDLDSFPEKKDAIVILHFVTRTTNQRKPWLEPVAASNITPAARLWHQYASEVSTVLLTPKQP